MRNEKFWIGFATGLVVGSFFKWVWPFAVVLLLYVGAGVCHLVGACG